MPARIHGGVFEDQVLTGSLKHFRISGADFSGAVDANNKPILGSAAELVYSELSKRATIVIMNPIANDNNGMSFALETNRADWNDSRIQEVLRSFGANVGVDHLDFTNITVLQVPYDFSMFSDGGATAFIQLTDVPNTYAGSPGKIVAVNSTSTGLIFIDQQPVGLDSDYIPAIANQTLVVGKKYVAPSAMSLYMPTYSGLSVGKSITISKSVSASVVSLFTSTGELFGTDIGTDREFVLDLSQDVVMIFDGTVWSVQLGALVLVH